MKTAEEILKTYQHITSSRGFVYTKKQVLSAMEEYRNQSSRLQPVTNSVNSPVPMTDGEIKKWLYEAPKEPTLAIIETPVRMLIQFQSHLLSRQGKEEKEG